MVMTTPCDQGEVWGLWRFRGAPHLNQGVREFWLSLPAMEQMYLGNPGKMTGTQKQWLLPLQQLSIAPGVSPLPRNRMRGNRAYSLDFPGGAGVKNPPACAGETRDAGLTPESGRSPGEGYGNPRQYSRMENSMDRGAWRATAHGVTKSWTWLSIAYRVHTQDSAMFNIVQLLRWMKEWIIKWVREWMVNRLHSMALVKSPSFSEPQFPCRVMVSVEMMYMNPIPKLESATKT